jgi:hypothetical protein
VSRPRRVLSASDAREHLLVLAFEAVEIAAQFLVPLRQDRRIERRRRIGLIHDASLRDARLVLLLRLPDGLALRVGQRDLGDAFGLVLLAQALHHQFECALRCVVGHERHRTRRVLVRIGAHATRLP